MIVTIDGPAGAGKTTVARIVAQNHGFAMMDTGAMYRTCALAAVKDGAVLDSPASIWESVQRADIRMQPEGVSFRMMLAGHDVTDFLHTPEIDAAVTPVCQVPEIRHQMTQMQREIGMTNDIVCEGRDMGTVVFPKADIKIWLTANADARAIRRALQRGDADVAETKADLQRRDAADASRDLAPMVMAEDAILVDSSQMTLAEVVARIDSIIADSPQTRR